MITPTKSKRFMYVLLFFLMFMFTLISFPNPLGSEAVAKFSNNKIILPPNFDFTSAIKNEFQSEKKYFSFFKIKDTDSAYASALANLILGLVKNDPVPIQDAKKFFEISSKTSDNIKAKELSLHGISYANNLLTQGFKDAADGSITFERIKIEKQKPPIKDFKKIIIGKSSIKITKDFRIKTQVDRVTRDWLSAYNISVPPWQFSKDKTVPWHEGKKIIEILDLVDAKVSVVWGTKAKKINNKWYAPDAEGVYRFKISEDKVDSYPTGIIIDKQTVFINDTHGINAIAWDSLDADLVVGCGDLDGKVEAAYYLAKRGVNVYMPTDRFIDMLIGVKTKGTIIGSAPIKKTSDGAIIGSQPISIDINEPIMVTNTTGGYPLQYYDAPYRYFRELEKYIGKDLKIMPVDITEYGKADKIVERALRIGVKVIGVRVASKEEHQAISWWLKADKSRRAVLFHSAVYPEGYRLFFEFPNQTTFGDINIGLE